ncbi:MAG: hypothetical protein NVSMB64_16630 [Candidatus Velthaea sp.]
MDTTTIDAENARRLYALATEMTAATRSPVVRDVGIAILALSKVLLSEAAPESFEHVRPDLHPLA